MKIHYLLSVAFVLGSAGQVAAQSDDAATERARLANQRIQAEAARREREEEQRDAAELAARQASVPAVAGAANDGTPRMPNPSQPMPTSVSNDQRPPVAPSPPVADPAALSEALDQLRRLGELKDAGYLTDAEFAAIKERILASTLK